MSTVAVIDIDFLHSIEVLESVNIDHIACIWFSL